jgi:hypothetical protein
VENSLALDDAIARSNHMEIFLFSLAQPYARHPLRTLFHEEATTMKNHHCFAKASHFSSIASSINQLKKG